jgi:hypothetical protein
MDAFFPLAMIVGGLAILLLGLWGLESPPMDFSSHSARIWGVITTGSALALLHFSGSLQDTLNAGLFAKPGETAGIALFAILFCYCTVLEVAVLLGLTSDE